MEPKNFGLIFLLLIGTAMACQKTQKKITTETWGSVGGKEVKKYTLYNSCGQEVDVISYGAIISSIRIPDKNGKTEDVALGFDNIEGYLNDTIYFGATIGRVGNRIRNGKFTLDGVQYNVSRNRGDFILHGGFKGWSHKVWESYISGDSVVMSLLSEDGDEGFPGDVICTLTFVFTDKGELIMNMKAMTTKATPINLTNHSYFNLAGHGTNAAELYKHIFTLNADRYTVTDADNIPTGEIRSVENSIFDLRKPTILEDVINQVPIGGFDNNYCLPEPIDSSKQKFVAKVVHPDSGRVMEVYSNQPGFQFYTSIFLPEEGSAGLPGKGGQKYFKHGAYCLETQNFPDAVNHENFPNSIVRPHEMYKHIVTYKFGVEA